MRTTLGANPLRSPLLRCRSPYHVVELVDAAAVAEANPAGDGMVYVFARTGSDSVRARFFAGNAGITEDPATGSAAVGLGGNDASGRCRRGSRHDLPR